MKWFCAILLFILLVGSMSVIEATKDGASETQTKSKVFPQEDECSRVGGMCIQKSDCPPERLSKGSCPKNKEAGAVCCHDLPSTETVCQKLGGSCRESCPESLVIGRADDCEEGFKCCPLV